MHSELRNLGLIWQGTGVVLVGITLISWSNEGFAWGFLVLWAVGAFLFALGTLTRRLNQSREAAP